MNLLVLLLLGTLSAVVAAEPQNAVVVVPVADVWSRPLMPGEKPSDELRETQVLFGEKVIVHESSGPWSLIEALEQPEFTHHNRWEGYPGWVSKDSLAPSQGERAGVRGSLTITTQWAPIHLDRMHEKTTVFLPLGATINKRNSDNDWTRFDYPSMQPFAWIKNQYLGSRGELLNKLVEPQIRSDVLENSEILSGTSYLWGGLTPGNPPPSPTPSPPKGGEGIKYGIDCSGLVHLAYRVNGITVPRDSHEQWMKAKPITRAEIKPADLIFSAKADYPKKITHVALYVGDGQIIEAPQTGIVVRKISFKEKYGKEITEVESGDKVGERVIYFGSFLQK